MKEYLDAQAAARDEALEALEVKRGAQVALATQLAVKIAKRKGSVTSTEVLEAMKDAGADLAGIDKRFMGAVFKSGKGWVQIGVKPWGSHRRPIAVWRLASVYFGER